MSGLIKSTPVTELVTLCKDGRNAYLCDGVKCALGREPKDFADYARNVAATGVWETSA